MRALLRTGYINECRQTKVNRDEGPGHYFNVVILKSYVQFLERRLRAKNMHKCACNSEDVKKCFCHASSLSTLSLNQEVVGVGEVDLLWVYFV